VNPLTPSLLDDQRVVNLTWAGINAMNIDVDTISSSPNVFEAKISTLMNGPGTNNRQDIGSCA